MKKIILLIALCTISLFTTGCFKSDTMEDITIHTTVYPIEYITERLYGEYSTISSVYPDGVNVNTYKLTKKQIKDFSDGDLFIFNGLNSEKELVSQFFKYNKRIKIIDATSSMEFETRDEELWMNPSNLLFMASNIKTGFNEYVTNHYIKESIESNYNALKLDISNLEAEINLISENATSKTLIVTDDLFMFLTKFGFNVISLDSDTATEKTISTAKALLANKKSTYIFAPTGEKLNKVVQDIVDATEAKVAYLEPLSNISELDRNNRRDYISIMQENILALKNELYK